MALSIELAKVSFSAGELSPELRARSDLAKNQTGLWFLENMVVLLEGGVTRRPGTRMVLPYKDPARPGVGIPFRFAGSGSNAYLIVFNGGVIRFVLNNSVVLASGVPYELASPYADADLRDANGVCSLRWSQSGNVMYLFSDAQPTQTLTRNRDNSWTLAPYITAPATPIPQGGCIAPPDNENLDPTQTIAISSTIGVIALTAAAAGPAFSASHVGTVWRLDESTLALVAEWTGNETIAVPTQALPAATGHVGSLTNLANAFDANTATEATQAALAAGAFFYAGSTFAAGQSVVSATVSDPSKYLAANASTPAAWVPNTPYAAGSQVTYAGSNWQAIGNIPAGRPIPPPSDPSWQNIGVAAYACTLFLYGKNGVPANATDGALLGTITIGTTTGYNGTIQSSDAISTWTSIWIAGQVTTAVSTITVAEITFSQFTGGGAPVLRRWNGNVYQAINGGNSGANPPLHSNGAVFSGTGGITWLYRHRDRGFVLITAVSSAISALGTVLERIPDSVLSSPTPNFWPPAWDGTKGWPNRGMLFKNSLVSARQGKFWKTQPGTFNNYDIVDPTNPGSAISGQLISPSGSLAWIEWFMQGGWLVAGTRDEEWVMAGQNILASLSVANLDPYPSRQEGSAPHVPAFVEGGMAFIGRSRDRVHHATLQVGFGMPQIVPEELTLTARHILRGKALGIAHQRDPNRINWLWCQDGTLVGNSLMIEQQINGWHRHPLTNGAVEWVAAIPTNDEGASQVYLGTRRTINGQTARFVELLQPFFQPANPAAPDASGAWFVDCGLQYVGARATTITGLDHLAGQQVAVHADGAMYLAPDGSLPTVGPVPGGIGITLTRPTQNAIIGLPISYRVRLLPLDVSSQQHGTTAGERSKANHFLLYVVNSAGGNIAGNPDEGPNIPPEPLDQTGALDYGAPVPLLNGIIRTPGIAVPLADQCVVEISGSDTMPFTLTGVLPDLEVTETT